MRRTGRLGSDRGLTFIATAVAMALILSSACVTGPQPVTPYERAAIGYVELSIGYEAALDVVVAARSERLISDEQWRLVDSVQRSVAKAQPKVRALLSLWKVTNEKPGDYDAVYSALIAEIAKLREVQP